MSDCEIVAEIGQNHNGDMGIATTLVQASIEVGADLVKLQKRSIPDAIPEHQRGVERDTPWGVMTYADYRARLELSWRDIGGLRAIAQAMGADLFMSVWDKQSAEELAQFAPWPYIKIPSARLTDLELVRLVAEKATLIGCPVILSVGMSTEDEIKIAETITRQNAPDYILLHCHSAYPAPSHELNLAYIRTLKERYLCRVGYSGHEWGISTTEWAVLLGAEMVERHITLDRTMWGSDQLASLEPNVFGKMVGHIRSMDAALGSGEKRVWPSEEPKRRSLRGN